MKTNEKIDFLMKITNTANSVLGKYLTFDASYISRIRSGKRKLPQNQPFAEPAALFFADRIQDEYQKKIAVDFICPGKTWPDNQRIAQKLILEWMTVDDSEEMLADRKAAKAAQRAAIENTSQTEGEVQLFYENEGKRKAVTLFLTRLCQMENPPQLLLYSNEEFDWMYEDPVFARQWAQLLFEYIKKGGKIKIAHTISRASGEMIVALQKWIPVYMTGAVQPYYYPKTLDRVFRKTMFVAEGHSAIVSGSVGEHTEEALNFLIQDKRAVKAIEEQFWSFFELCKPLMQIYNVTGREKFHDVLKKFNQECENMITVRTVPSFFTMPKEVAKSMTERLDNSWVMKRQKEGEKAFHEMMKNGKHLMEILNLPDPKKIVEQKTAFPMCDFFDRPGLYYTVPEFTAHLDAVIMQLKTNENYHVVTAAVIPENEIVYVKEDMGALLLKTDFPSIAFVINEQRMVSAFWDYLTMSRNSGRRKNDVIHYLEEYKKKLQNN